MKIKTVVVASMFLALAWLPAQATIITWEFNLPVGPLETSHTYSALGYDLTVYGFQKGDTSTPSNLYGKNEADDGWGVGLTADTVNHNIQSNDFVQLDFANPLSLASSAVMLVDDVQMGDMWSLYGSNTLGQLGTLVRTDTAENIFDVPNFGQYRYYGVTTISGGVLVAGVQVDSSCAIPEPATSVLFGGSLIGLALTSRRLAAKRRTRSDK